MLKVIAAIVFITSSITCNDKGQLKNSKVLKELKTKTGKTVIISEAHPEGMSWSSVQITIIGYKPDESILAGKMDPVKNAALADIDHDGFEEIYLFTQSAGSGSTGNFYAYDFDKKNKFVKLITPLIKEEDYQQGSPFEGYMGHDTFIIENDQLIREFPVYKEKDTNSQSTGGKKRIFYKLNNGRFEISKTEIIN